MKPVSDSRAGLTKRLMFRVSKFRAPNIDSLPKDLIRPTCIVPKHRDRLRDVFANSRLVRLAIIPRINGRQDMTVPFAKIGELP